MAARYALGSFWWHNTSSGHDEFVNIGALRDTTHQAVVQRPEQFTTTPLVVGQTGIDPKLGEYLKVHGGGPGE
jgi:hypothetical protein